MKRIYSIYLLFFLLVACQSGEKRLSTEELAQKVRENESIAFTKQKAREVVKTGFNAGDGYREVWIRDYNTFIELAAELYDPAELKENLLVFFRMQGDDGNILDGFTPREDTIIRYDFTYTEMAPNYAGHKNTVETDQETSLVQTVYKYIKATGDQPILDELIGDMTVAQRLEAAMEFLITNRYVASHNLLWGATTADWGDVQPEHGWGVDLDENTHRAIDIYDNAMFIIALDNLMEMIPSSRTRWEVVRDEVFKSCRKHLWDKENQKFIPHIYLEGSPFPDDFNENEIYYFGGTAIAIEASLLSVPEIEHSLNEMVKRAKEAGAPSIGLTLYPPYPEGFFENQIMNPEYSYQNGGDWTWFGGRMIQQLVRYGFLQEAYERLLPMTERVLENDGFYEWYSINNEPRGSGTFRGSAGVLYVAIEQLERALANE